MQFFWIKGERNAVNCKASEHYTDSQKFMQDIAFTLYIHKLSTKSVESFAPLAEWMGAILVYKWHLLRDQ